MNIKPQLEKWKRIMGDFSIQAQDKIFIYGTEDGAILIGDILKEIGRFGQIEGFIDRDNSPKIGNDVLGKKICRLQDCYRDVDVIIIGAYKSHVLIGERLEAFRQKNINSKFRIIDLFAHNTQEEELDFLHYWEKSILKEKSPDFIDFDNRSYIFTERDTKIIAWYLPQYHEMEINNKYLGRGFTEWTNTTRAIPLYKGHYQPHIPYDVGYYSLNNIETFIRQIELARHYGVYGFSFYYYWFSGKKFMEKPLQQFLSYPELNINFCVTWANENWTTLWDGGQHEIIYQQEIAQGYAEKLVDDLLPVISDSRYITINGKPLLIIYRGNLFDKSIMLAFLSAMRQRVRNHGFKDLYIMITTAGNFDEEVTEWGADALVEFPPHGMKAVEAFRPQGYINPYFVGKILDTEKFIAEKKYMYEHKAREYYRAALTSWDNTARKARTGALVYHGLSPITFKQWLWDIVVEGKKNHSGDYDMVFVNAWNEWAEGSHLEPDMKYGYAYLDAIKEVVEKSRDL